MKNKFLVTTLFCILAFPTAGQSACDVQQLLNQNIPDVDKPSRSLIIETVAEILKTNNCIPALNQNYWVYYHVTADKYERRNKPYRLKKTVPGTDFYKYIPGVRFGIFFSSDNNLKRGTLVTKTNHHNGKSVYLTNSYTSAMNAIEDKYLSNDNERLPDKYKTYNGDNRNTLISSIPGLLGLDSQTGWEEIASLRVLNYSYKSSDLDKMIKFIKDCTPPRKVNFKSCHLYGHTGYIVLLNSTPDNPFQPSSLAFNDKKQSDATVSHQRLSDVYYITILEKI